MKKSPIIIFIVTAVFLTGCSKPLALNPKKTQTVAEETQLETPNEAPNEDESFSNAEKLLGVDEMMDIILREAPEDFFGNYVIDENFLVFIVGNYGSDILKQLCEGMNSEGKELWYKLTGRSIHTLMCDYYFSTGLKPDMVEKVYYQDCANDDKIIMDFTGDINLGENMGAVMRLDKEGISLKDCFDEDTLNEMRGADIFVVNNECTLSTKGTALEGKAYTFRGNPERVSNLLDIGTDVAGLANNHIYDYGEEALLETVETLESAGIPTTGAAKNLEEASKPVYFICNGRKIAIIATTEIERSTNYTKAATETTAGTLKCLEPAYVNSLIRKTKRVSDYVVVFVHWGTEGDENYGWDQVNLSEGFQLAGADAVIGGHTHCLQGMGYVEDMPVAYSLGNYWFSSTTNLPGGYNTGLAQLVITNDLQTTLRFIPCRFVHGKVKMLHDDEAQNIYKYLTNISTNVHLDENGIVIKN